MTKRMIRNLLLTVAAMAAAAGARAQVDVNVNVSIGGFYDELAPYGQWVDCSYGQCWVPGRVDADWQPYSNGQWVYTQYGWTWASSDPWGGSPYHYGTWTSIPGYGWSWVPGTVWAPAWVTWNYSNNYVGWAPLPPTVVLGASGYSGRPIIVQETQYVFVPTNRFVGGNVMTARMSRQQSAAIFRETKPVTGFSVSGGIVRNTALPMATIERAHGGKIETRSVQTAHTAPRAMAAGHPQMTLVAPASEVKAAVAARPNAAQAARSTNVALPPKGPGSPERAPANAPASPKTREGASPDAHPQPAEAGKPRPPRPEAQPQPMEHARPPSAAPAHEAKSARPPQKPEPNEAQAQPADRPDGKGAKPKPPPEQKQSRAPVDHQPGQAKPERGPEPPPMESHQPQPEARRPAPPPPDAARPHEDSAPKPRPNPPKEKPPEKPDAGRA